MYFSGARFSERWSFLVPVTRSWRVENGEIFSARTAKSVGYTENHVLLPSTRKKGPIVYLGNFVDRVTHRPKSSNYSASCSIQGCITSAWTEPILTDTDRFWTGPSQNDALGSVQSMKLSKTDRFGPSESSD
jgi:hypothetical protein